MVGAVAGLPAGALEEVTLTVRLNSAADFVGVCLDGAHLSGGPEWLPNVNVPSSIFGRLICGGCISRDRRTPPAFYAATSAAGQWAQRVSRSPRRGGEGEALRREEAHTSSFAFPKLAPLANLEDPT